MSRPDSAPTTDPEHVDGFRRLRTAAEVRSFDPSDPFLHWEIPTAYAGPAYAHGAAMVLARRTQTRGPGMAVIGPPADVAALLDVVITTGRMAEFTPANLASDESCFDVVAERFVLGPGGVTGTGCGPSPSRPDRTTSGSRCSARPTTRRWRR